MATRDGALSLSADDRAANDSADWKRAHAALSRLARERAAVDAEEGRWLLRALRSAAHVHLGFGSFAEYVERLFGYRPRTTQEKLRVAEALEGLPCLSHALETGTISWCAARELTRVASAETESAWLETARGKTLRELEALVADKAPGDEPDAPRTERPRLHVLRFEVSPETFATFREAMLRTRRQAGGSLSDDALLLAMARQVLGGPRDDGRASYQISLQVCSTCASAAQAAAGELVPVDAAVVGMGLCDGQHLGELLPSAVQPPPPARRAANENATPGAISTAALGARAPASIEPSGDETHDERVTSTASANQLDRRRQRGSATTASDGIEPGATHDSSDLDQRHVGSWQGSEARACSTTHESADDAHVGGAPGAIQVGTIAPGPTPQQQPAAAARPSRAKQTIPPALRRAVLARDRHRCTVPGCTHATFVDVHHIQPRSEGGRHEPTNLLTLCSAHHRAAHRGELHIERGTDALLRFRHADGAAYGNPLAPHLIDAHSKVFSALRNLGFPESAVKAVLRELRADAELATASVKHLLREALCRIRPTAR